MDDKPTQGALITDLGRGVTLRLPDVGNKEWVYAHLREGDRAEYDAAVRFREETGDAHTPPPLKELFVWAGDDLIARWGSFQTPGTTLLGNVRSWSWETTTDADKHWRLFVRMTLPVWRALWAIEDAHVTHCIVSPIASYAKTLRWQTRYFRQQELGRVLIGDEPHIVYAIYREEKQHGH